MQLLQPTHWTDYELLDSGDFEKLERFGSHVLRRPEPQAVWPKQMGKADWEERTDARFVQEGSHSGHWQKRKNLPDQWHIAYRYKRMRLRFRLGLTAFKHVGIFPEQAANWVYTYEQIRRIEAPRVLNLFAYTGGASLAARSAGADVIHCDSVRAVVSWAKANMEASRLSQIRWLIEDAYTFVKREVRRGRQYHGIILDPPAYGHGPKGEKWKLDEMLNDLVAATARILAPDQQMYILNSYSLGFSPLVLRNLVHSHFPHRDVEWGELVLSETQGERLLPTGVYARFAAQSLGTAPTKASRK